MKTSNQLDGTNDEITSDNSKNKKKNCRKKKSNIIQISLQLDGTGPPVSCFSVTCDLSSLFCIGW
jgi:hypothetical protein